MARLARLYAPNIPQLIQADLVHALAAPGEPPPQENLDQIHGWLRTEARERGIAVHGWLLLSDRIGLLATPPAVESLPRLMQALGRRLAGRLHRGRVFKGRYRGALVQPGLWLLPAQVWLETLPVQLQYVDDAEIWPWSSAAWHAGLPDHRSTWTVDHPDYWNDGNTPFARQAAYRRRLHEGVSSIERRQIEAAVFGQWALGDENFVRSLRSVASRRLLPAAKGRPRKTPARPE